MLAESSAGKGSWTNQPATPIPHTCTQIHRMLAESSGLSYTGGPGSEALSGPDSLLAQVGASGAAATTATPSHDLDHVVTQLMEDNAYLRREMAAMRQALQTSAEVLSGLAVLVEARVRQHTPTMAQAGVAGQEGQDRPGLAQEGKGRPGLGTGVAVAQGGSQPDPLAVAARAVARAQDGGSGSELGPRPGSGSGSGTSCGGVGPVGGLPDWAARHPVSIGVAVVGGLATAGLILMLWLSSGGKGS